MAQTNLSTKQKQIQRCRKQTCGLFVKGERGGSGMDWEFWFSKCKLLYIERINNKVLLYSTGNSIRDPVTDNNGSYGARD